MRYNIILTFTVDALDAFEADAIGETIADHVVDTCNDDASIDAEVGIRVTPEVEA